MATSTFQITRSPLARRVVIYTVLFSSLITLLLTVIQLHREYLRDIDDIDHHFSLTRDAHLDPIRDALWATNRENVQLQLDGILHFQDIKYAEIREGNEVWATAGEPTSANVISRSYPIIHSHRGTDLVIGTLSVVASLDGVYRRLLDRVVVILLSNGVKTLFVALFVLFILHHLLGRHIRHITDYLAPDNDDAGGELLRLDRKQSGKSDELDLLVDSVNQMRDRVSRAMDALFESEGRYREMVELGSDWIWELDADGKFSYSTANTRAQVNFDLDYVLGKRREDLPGADPDGGSWNEYRDALGEQKSFRDFGYSVLDAKGKRRHVLFSGNPRFDDQGNFTGYRGVSRDDTDKLAAERKALAAHTQFGDAIESLSNGFILYDTDDRVVTCNQAYRRLTGLDVDFNLDGLPFKDLVRVQLERGIFPKAEGREEEWFAERMRHRQTRTPLEIRLRNGTWIHVRDQRTSRGNSVTIVADITELKQAEQKFLESESRYRTLFDIVPAALWLQDFSAIWRELNEFRSEGVTDLGKYFREYPEEVSRLSKMIQVVEVNRRTLELYGGKSKDEVDKGYVYSDSTLDMLRDELVAFYRGEKWYQSSHSVKDQTLSGKAIKAIVSAATCAPEDPHLVLSSVTDVSRLENLELAFIERAQRLEALIRTSAKLAGSVRLDETLGSIADEAAKLMEVDGVGFRLLDGNKLIRVGSYGIASTVMINDAIHVGESLSGIAVKEGRTIAVSDFYQDPRLKPAHRRAAEVGLISAYLGVPLRHQNRTIGVLNVYGKKHRVFNDMEIRLFQAFADHAAIAIERTRLYEDLKRHADGLIHEIAERQRIEVALRESEALFQQAEHMANLGHWVWDDVEDCLASCSEQFARIFGMSIDQCQSTFTSMEQWLKFVHVDDRERYGKTVAQAEAKLNPVDVKYRMIMQDGSVHHVHEVAKPVVNETGALIRTIGTLQDVTERRKIERALSEKERQLDAIFAHSPAEIYLKDAEGRYVRISREFERRFGVQNEDMVGKLPPAAHDERMAAISRAQDIQVLDSGRPILQEHAATFIGDSHEHSLLTLKFPIFNDAGAVDGLGAIVTDITEQKRAEEELKRSEQQLRLITDSLPILIAFLDRDLIYRFANKTTASWFGCAREEIVGRNISEFLGGANFEKLEFRLKAALQGKPQNFDTEIAYPDGKRRHVNIIYTPQKTPDGAIAGIYALVLDITERKRVQNALAASEERARSVFNTTDDGIIVIDESGTVESVNPASEKLFGYKENEIIGKNVKRLMPESFRDDHVRSLRRYLKTGQANIVGLGQREVEGRRKDATQFPMEIAINEMRVSGRRMFTGVVRDISERKAAERSLKESERQLRLVTDNLPSLIVYVDAGCRFRFVNRTGEAWYARPRSEIIGKHLSEILGDSVFAQLEPLIDGALRGELQTKDQKITHPDGKSRDVHVSYVPQFNDEEQVQGFYAMIVDVSERKRAEAALRAAEEQNRLVLESVGEGIYGLDVDGKATFVNPAAAHMLGYTPEELIGRPMHALIHHSHADGSAYPPEACPMYAAFTDGEVHEVSNEVLWHKDGSSFPVEYVSTPIRKDYELLGAVVTFRDVTERKLVERYTQDRSALLEMVAKGRPLAEVLTALVDFAEEQAPEMLGSVLLLDGDGHTLRNGASPNLPASYVEAVDGLEIGPRVGSCGTAAFSRRRVIVADIQSDPLWADFRDLASSHALAACWSQPIFATDGKVLGTFALYYRTPHEPSEKELRMIEEIANIAAIAVERMKAIESLGESEQRLRLALQAAKAGVWKWEIGTQREAWSDEYFHILGYEPGEIEPSFDRWQAAVHPDDRAETLRVIEESKVTGADMDLEYRIVRPDGEVRWIQDFGRIVFDKQGAPVDSYGLQIDITEQRRTAEGLRDSQRQLRAVIEEREQLSQDLHDGIVQRIYAIGLGLEEVKALMKRNPTVAYHNVSNAIENLNGVIREVRKYIAGAPTYHLSERQLRAELNALTRMSKIANQIEFDLRLDPVAITRLPAEAANDVINIAREAMSNSLRHSKGSSGRVSLHLHNQIVRLTVEDDGIGFDVQATASRGDGLRNIAVRAARHAAKFDIVSNRDSGTRIIIDIPARDSATAH